MMLRSLLLLLLSSVVRPRELSLIVGGYKAADRHDENVQTAAKFAVTSLMQDAPYDTLTVTSMDDIHIAIASAQVQVVAGLNYKLTVILKDQDGACMGAFDVDIYDHFGDMQVTHWGDEHSCADAHAIKREFKEKGQTGQETEGDTEN